MARKVKPANQMQVNDTYAALELLQQARLRLKAAGCPKAMARVEAAIRSTQGAMRHAWRRLESERDL